MFVKFWLFLRKVIAIFKKMSYTKQEVGHKKKCGTQYDPGSDDMKQLVHCLKKLIPDQLEIFTRRYQILKIINKLQPIGRRSIAQCLGVSERIARSEIDKLNEEGFLEVEKAGMFLTPAGEEILKNSSEIMREILGFSELEQKIQELLQVKKVIIAEGNSDENESIKREIGAMAAQEMLKQIHPDSTISLTGGSTMEYLVDSIPVFQAKKARLVVPARGSVGHNVEQQSDTLASRLAVKLNAEYRLLHIPDSLGIKAMNEIKNEPSIQDALSEMQQATIVLFGIGDALRMAEKRRVSEAIYDYLIRKEAIGEAFGYYFNAEGEIVYTSRSISISLEAIKKIPCIIAVAGGTKKARAIIAVSKNFKECILVMDEAAAKKIISILEMEQREIRLD